MPDLNQAVINTLTYSDYFHSPLTFDELFSRLINYPTSRCALSLALARTIRSHLLVQTDSYYHLPGRESLVHLCRYRKQASASKLALARSRSHLLSRLPGIVAIYLTGAVAVGNATPSDDLDLMIITDSGKLWITRLLLTLLTSLLGWRRLPQSGHFTNKLCLNLYLTPISLKLPPSRRSLYTAYELIQAVPLYDPHHTHQALLSSNSWLKHYLPNYQLPSRPRSFVTHNPSLPIRLIERFTYLAQLAYMRPKQTRELITPHVAFFHPRDPSQPLLSRLNL